MDEPITDKFSGKKHHKVFHINVSRWHVPSGKTHYHQFPVLLQTDWAKAGWKCEGLTLSIQLS